MNIEKIISDEIIREFPNGILVLDNELNIIFCNEEASKLFHNEKQSLEGKNFSILELNKDDKSINEKFLNCLANKKQIKNHFNINNKLGNVQSFIKTKNIKIDSGNYTIISISDISSLSNCAFNLNKPTNKTEFLHETIIGKDEKF